MLAARAVEKANQKIGRSVVNAAHRVVDLDYADASPDDGQNPMRVSHTYWGVDGVNPKQEEGEDIAKVRVLVEQASRVIPARRRPERVDDPGLKENRSRAWPFFELATGVEGLGITDCDLKGRNSEDVFEE